MSHYDQFDKKIAEREPQKLFKGVNRMPEYCPLPTTEDLTKEVKEKLFTQGEPPTIKITTSGIDVSSEDWCKGAPKDWGPTTVKITDNVNHPFHYKNHPSGVECIQITEHMNFTLGNAMKYIWRADLKNGVEDLKKARWYLDREIARRENNEK